MTATPKEDREVRLLVSVAIVCTQSGVTLLDLTLHVRLQPPRRGLSTEDSVAP